MTAVSTTKALTPTQRAAAAVERVAQQLSLQDTRALSVVLAEIAAEEVATNRVFAERIQRHYQALTAKPGRVAHAPKPSAPRTGGPRPKVATRRTLGEHVDIVTPTDPRTLVPLYGQHLEAHLEQYSVRALSDMARVLMQHVGEKAPSQKSGRAILIAYILRHARGS
jgi:hypothetical protein